MARDWNKNSRFDPGNIWTPSGKFKRFPPCLSSVSLSADRVATNMNDYNQSKLNPGVEEHRFESSSSTQVRAQSEKENIVPGMVDESENRNFPMLHQRIELPPSQTTLTSFYGEESRLYNDTKASDGKHGILTQEQLEFIIPRPTKNMPGASGMHPLSEVVEEIEQKITYNESEKSSRENNKMIEDTNKFGVWKIRSNYNSRFELKIPARKEESLYAVKNIRDIHGYKRPIHLVIPYEFQNQIENPEENKLQMDLLKACDFVPIQPSNEDYAFVETISDTKDIGGTVNEEMSNGKIIYTDTEYTSSGIEDTNDNSDMKKIWYLY